MSHVIRLGRLVAAAALVALLAACAHPISINAQETPARVEAQLIQKKVAYAVSDADRKKEVITPGGGGDRISYYPYRDLEKGMRDALRSVYQDVVVISSAADKAAVQESGAALIFKPEITTTSSSPSPFTWPPTQFSTDISCVVADATGAEITKLQVQGSGVAEFSEFKSNFGLAAQRAGTDVAAKLAEEIRKNGQLH